MASTTAPPPGYHSVTPRMFVDDIAATTEFLRVVFDAVGEVLEDRPAELRIGDSLVMVASTEHRDCFPAFLYVYVGDADTTYRRAIDAGAESLEEPLDTPDSSRAWDRQPGQAPPPP